MIEVITGPMFSGKTKTLIYKIELAKEAGLSVIVFKPRIESRNQYEDYAIATHDLTNTYKAKVVDNGLHMLREMPGYDLIAIDEAQFFDPLLYVSIQAMRSLNKWIIVVGLDMDFKGEPFPAMANIMAIANKVNKLESVCDFCKKPAQFSYRKTTDSDTVLIGGADHYSAKCLNCFNHSINSNQLNNLNK